MNEDRSTVRKLGIGLLGVAIFAALAALVVNFLQGDAKPKRHVVTTITTVKLPPPPPPPPPPEKPPEPEKIEEPKIKEPDPIKPEVQKPEPLPSPPPLGLGFEGEGGPGGYGNIGVAGAGTGIGGGGNGGGEVERWYAGVIVGDLERALQRDERTRQGTYRVVLKLWLDASGAVSRAQLVGSSGDTEQDRDILAVVDEHVFSEPLPDGVRLPIQVRLSGRRPT